MTGAQAIPAPDGPGAGTWVLPGYTPSRELGSGASGRVVLARHDETGSPVAIKYLSQRLRGDSTFLAGFRAEARLLGTLRSPYVVELYEYVETSLGAAIVMELVDGIPLRALLRQEGATEPEAALTVLKGSLLGLAAAHEAGVVHRDYKPDNVLIAADGTSKLVDFGIAVPSGEAGNAAGTPVYMAPEQWTGRAASPATDVYAATATFFECLTGAKPYAGETAMELAIQHMEAPIPDALAPEPVRPLIRRGLAKTPGERPASAADLVAELEAVATAAYGEDWEERGQRGLAALVALLLFLFPLADPGASGTTALATTSLGPSPDPGPDPGPGRSVRSRLPLNRRGKTLAGMAAGALLLGGITVTAVAVGSRPVNRPAASGAPATASPSGSASTTTAASAEPSKNGPASASVSAEETQGEPSAGDDVPPSTDNTTGQDDSPGGSSSGGGGTSGSSSTGGGTSGGSSGTGTSTSGGTSSGGAPGGGTAEPSTAPAPEPDVVSVTINASGPLGSGCAMVASVTVQTDGAADGTLTLSWFTGSSATAVGTVVATDPVSLPEGRTQVSGRYTHSFTTPERSPYLGVEVSTSPAADSGNGAFVTVSAPSVCDPPR